jgi:hypothetical protein
MLVGARLLEAIRTTFSKFKKRHPPRGEGSGTFYIASYSTVARVLVRNKVILSGFTNSVKDRLTHYAADNLET